MPICHPTRFEIMTGQYGHHNRVYNFPGRSAQEQGEGVAQAEGSEGRMTASVSVGAMLSRSHATGTTVLEVALL